MKIQERLRKTQTFIDPRIPKKWEQPINPDGFDAADYIDNALDHIGHIVSIAFQHIQDDDVREELRRRAFAAMRGTP